MEMDPSKLGIAIEDRYLMGEALSGDMVLEISPETIAPEPTAAAWSQTVTLTLKDADGNTHRWLNGAFTTIASVADGSTAGTASIGSTTVTFVNGVATVVLSGDAAAWLDTETATLTIANLTIAGYTVTGGTCVVTFTAV